MLGNFYRHWRLLLDTAALVVVVVAVKVLVDTIGWEFLQVSPLSTSIIAGGIFIVSILLSGTLTDYKEADRLPSEIAARQSSRLSELSLRCRQRLHLGLLRPEMRDLQPQTFRAQDRS